MSLSDNVREYLFPKAASAVADHYDAFFMEIFWLTVVIFFICMIPMVYFLFRYHRSISPEDQTPKITHHNTLEAVWTIIPTFIVIYIFAASLDAYFEMMVPPKNAYEIKVKGMKWNWQVEYPNGATELNHLVVPNDRPIKIVLTSIDVLHSFFLPQFRVKMDAVPNYYSHVWFHPRTEGEYDIYCTEYCGTNHSAMLAKMDVVSQADYDAHIEKINVSLPPLELGKSIFGRCTACHSAIKDGPKIVGPPLWGIFGKEVELTDGSRKVRDENYLRKSILDPRAELVLGFPPLMTPFQGTLKEKEVDGLIEYIKSLKD